MALSQDTFFLDPDFSGTLQSQIRQIITSAILSRRLQPGERLPSSRKLAEHLKISRITVTLSYQELVADGYLSTRSRSGYFVADGAPVAALPNDGQNPSVDTVDWNSALQKDYSTFKNVKKSFNWRDYPYPFNYGQADPSLFGHSNWRLCAHQALGKKEIDTLTSDYAEHDDPQLINFIVRHTLPRRGIVANHEQVLLTVGAQNALWMVSELLLSSNSCAAYENPGYPGVRQILRQSGCNKVPIDVDDEGLDPAKLPPETNVVYTTPSHHAPTTVTMPLERRRELLTRAEADNFLVVEDDYEFEMSFLRPPLPALKSLDTNGRVIYIGSFSKSLFPGLRLGYLVASEPFVEQARALRSTILRHPPGHMQRTTANFLALGHYNALIQRMKSAYLERHKIMVSAMQKEGLEVAGRTSFGGSCFWMKAPERVDTEVLYERLLGDGVLIEPGNAFFVRANRPQNFYRLAYSSIQPDKIGPGIRLISKQIEKY
ncbi:MAG: PLP-dependent aminotransferase family protein [Rhodobacteraceae bacterium]|nr:PLP-dependent aminotransferase family protein [Paracoccaceae bacterium]